MIARLDCSLSTVVGCTKFVTSRKMSSSLESDIKVFRNWRRRWRSCPCLLFGIICFDSAIRCVHPRNSISFKIE